MSQLVENNAGNLTWTVEVGQIRMGAGVEVLIDNPDVKIVDIDCDSKYPEVWVALHEDAPELMLLANENTLRWSTPVTEPTRIKFSPGWDILAPETGRYTIRVALYRTRVIPPGTQP